MKWISAWIIILPIWAANRNGDTAGGPGPNTRILLSAISISYDRSVLKDTAKQPTVVLEEGVLGPMVFLTIKDTAANQADMTRIFSKDYGRLYSYLYQNGLKPGIPLARYYSVQPVFVFDVGVEVGEGPITPEGNIKMNRIEGGPAIIAHFKGPYGQIGIAYAAIHRWLTANNKIAQGQPFELYLNQPATVHDPFELRTDIYQLITPNERRGDISVKEILIPTGW